ncbi:Stk1 family PASTA domain-containing Ser/Thr kinase [Microbacterium sp. zg.Y1090]|uniref:Stk1 family PASTA domain-containing Ser/Thr kinase n=1 Tax=Microbacterium wangruii TaxID=3049073 RepID=UPI00214DCD90|nr:MULTISPECIES: Stk1 family PASTA domain-containing Ser/Thr kinase [unclassified Microbacterium]MCR2819355.1 Stk1 family PASTA domain-containing Ser/Thr kinase [Microbacterium sp. zg.Y1090]MDL5487272.1 Stk1 family PASTA domain-containing Ser/Thr kinase [Microbacterium sp. zg-Y1211]WIM28335.1 Stk1 family PASTA domain-containing Ser/Thr kinase [Microbacterium sp. zg-Y1090]
MSAEPRVLSGRYRVDEPIGRGGMARVYRGYDLTLGRPVAIKILKRDLAEDSAFRTRFRLEAQAASRMSNPTIVRVYDAGEDAETDPDGSVHPVPYIVMELVDGELLKDLVAAGPLAADTAVRYVDGILEALEYSHRAGVVHRDIKPGNVMVTDSGQVKVMDFGIARAVSDSSSTVADTTAILGTAAYFSPEQAKGEPVDARADVYSTGVVLYELLTGRQPFRGESPVAVAYQHVSETPVPPSEVNPTVPRALDAVVLRALAKDPFQRFQDAAAFREALDSAVDGRTPSKRQVGALTSQLYGPDPRQAQDTARSLRQLTTDTTMTRTQSGPPAAWIWAGVVLLIALLASLVFWVVSIQPGTGVPSNARIVPNVTDMAYERAEQLLLDEDLEPTRLEEPSDTVAAGNVIRVSPASGTSVAIGEKIDVFVSTGVETTAVPRLVGLNRAAADEALRSAGLRLGSATMRNDPAAAAGTVLSASQEEGAEVPEGTAVNLEVATGQVTLIDVAGYTVEAATRELEADDKQLTVLTEENPECPAAPGGPVVLSQSLAPGDVPIHSTVTLVYCSGS